MATACRRPWQTDKATCVVLEQCFIRSGLWWQLTVSGLTQHVWWWIQVPVLAVALWGQAPSVKLWYIPTSPKIHLVRLPSHLTVNGSCCVNHSKILLQIMTLGCFVCNTLWCLARKSAPCAYLGHWILWAPLPLSRNGVQVNCLTGGILWIESASHRYEIPTV